VIEENDLLAYPEEEETLDAILDGEDLLDLSEVITETDPYTTPFDSPLNAKQELMRHGRDIAILHRKVAMGQAPRYQGNTTMLGEQFRQVMNLKSEDWQALLPKSLLDKIAKTGKVNQESIIELFIICLSGGYTYKEVEDLMYAQTELYRLCDIADLLQELEETKIRFQQRVR
jgi:hypothetical protein